MKVFFIIILGLNFFEKFTIWILEVNLSLCFLTRCLCQNVWELYFNSLTFWKSNNIFVNTLFLLTSSAPFQVLVKDLQIDSNANLKSKVQIQQIQRREWVSICYCRTEVIKRKYHKDAGLKTNMFIIYVDIIIIMSFRDIIFSNLAIHFSIMNWKLACLIWCMCTFGKQYFTAIT